MGWAYWAWKYYDDPTGSSAEGLVLPDGNYSPIVTVLSRTYPQAVAGIANSVLFNPFTGAFNMTYAPSLASRGATVIDIARITALPDRLVCGRQGRSDHLGPGRDASHHSDHRAPAAGLRLGDGGRLPVLTAPRPGRSGKMPAPLQPAGAGRSMHCTSK